MLNVIQVLVTTFGSFVLAMLVGTFLFGTRRLRLSIEFAALIASLVFVGLVAYIYYH